jgi:hypothetical protein
LSPNGRSSWNAVLNAFRALGGTAENLRPGGAGVGLHAIDATTPISLRVPPNLCFPLEDIEFVGGEMTLRERANFGPGERKFFETYTSEFSWGAGGEAGAAKFVSALDALPSEVRSLFENEFGMADLFDSDSAERTKAWFLRSRRFRLKSRDWFVPVAELARHDAQGLTPTSDSPGGLQIQGTVSGAVFVSRGAYDTLGAFCNFDIVAPQDQAYSLPLNVKGSATDIIIRRNPSNAVKRGAFVVPLIVSNQNTLTFSYLMIGHPKFPRLSRGIFLALVRDTQIAKPNETFDRVLFANRMKFLKLIGALEPHGGEIVIALRKAAHIQLERISHCIGKREL